MGEVSYELIIVGGGKMGSALLGGLVDAAFAPTSAMAVIEASPQRREELTREFPRISVHASLELDHVAPGTGVVLCVKPDVAEATARLAGACGTMRLLSVVAGLSTARLEAVMPGPVAVIRSMPNTPVTVRRGASAIAGGAHVTAADLDWAEAVLGAVGVVVRLSEKHLDAVTGLSGPMPAYLFMIVEALIEAGVHQGLPREVSETLVRATFAGAGELLTTSPLSAEQLRHEVTSPGGTTAAGLRMLEQRAVRAAFLEAVASAAERSRQLGR